ncbi:YciI family protein [Quadrisphaera sp. KR29]|uniref:YciI family protein n=1 Tax=Quadrisphaera sp. KR29 TaxID=3461391 RepID=UPI004044F30C
MPKYAILIVEDPAYYAGLSPEDWPAVVAAHGTFVQKVSELGGSLTGGEALAPPSSATTIKRGGEVVDGPFLSTREAVNGYYVIEARDRDHAIEIATWCPAPAPGGGVEVRPVVDPSSNPF